MDREGDVGRRDRGASEPLVDVRPVQRDEDDDGRGVDGLRCRGSSSVIRLSGINGRRSRMHVRTIKTTRAPLTTTLNTLRKPFTIGVDPGWPTRYSPIWNATTTPWTHASDQRAGSVRRTIGRDGTC